MKPEVLVEPNQYECEKCAKKVDAERGIRFLRLPNVLSISLSRFQLNYSTFNREKINDFVSFPLVLNFNDYMGSYADIKNKLINDPDEEYFKEKERFDKGKKLLKGEESTCATKGTTKKRSYAKKKPGASLATSDRLGKKPSHQTSEFMKEMRAKRMKMQSQPKQQGIVWYGSPEADDVFVEEQRHFERETGSKMEEEKCIPPPPEIPSQYVLPPIAKIHNVSKEKKTKAEISNGITTKIEEEETKKQPITNGIHKEETSKTINVSIDCRKYENKPKNSEKAPEGFLETEESRFPDSKELIKKYLEDGPMVYELYAILIHSGGAYGGHYYTFIKSFKNDKWFNFDDTIVREVSVNSIPDVCFGGKTNITNAYVLFYRLFGSDAAGDFEFGEKDLPPYILEAVKRQHEELSKRKEAEARQEGLMTFKIFHQTEMKMVQCEKETTLEELLAKSADVFKINKEKLSNMRFRAYEPMEDRKTQTYTGEEKKTVSELKFYNGKPLCIEIKSPGEQFEDFDAEAITLRVAVWNPSVSTINEVFLDIRQWQVHRSTKINDLRELVAKKLGWDPEETRLIKREIKAMGGSVPIELTEAGSINQSLLDHQVYENNLIYAENETKKGEASKWAIEIESDFYKAVIKFNFPYDPAKKMEFYDYDQSIIVDLRISFGELKTKICETIAEDPEEIVIRRGGKSGSEIKDLKSSLESLNFTTGSSVFLERGRPLKPGEIKVFLSIASLNLANQNSYFEFEDFGELVIHSGSLTSKLKKLISEELLKKKEKAVDPDLLRIREKNQEKLLRVFREAPLNKQGLLDKKALSVEIISQPENLTADENLVYVKILDPALWSFTETFELRIGKNLTLDEFAKAIFEKTNAIPKESMVVSKVAWTKGMSTNDLHSVDQWYPISASADQMNSFPFYQSTDGSLFIVKNKDIEPREFTEEEKKSMGIQTKRGLMPSSRRPVNGNNKAKTSRFSAQAEKSIKIQIKKKGETQTFSSFPNSVSGTPNTPALGFNMTDSLNMSQNGCPPKENP